MAALKYWVWLTTLPGLTNRSKLLLLEHFPSPEDIYYAQPEDLPPVEGLSSSQAALLSDKSTDRAENVLARCAKGDIFLLTMQDPCTARHDTAWQDAVRSLARKAGMIPEEPPQGRDRTACCGYGGLVWCAQPELADAMAGHRAGGLPHAALSSCIMCRDRLAGSGKPGLHLLDLLPQLAPLAHGLEPEKGPGLSERRARRAALRRRLARVWLGQELAEPAAGRLDLVPGLLEELERRHILLEDVDGAVAAVEAEKAYFVDAESGHRLGAWRPRNVTFWVEYTEEDGRWLLHDAWCHRMRVPGSGGVQENGCCGEA